MITGCADSHTGQFKARYAAAQAPLHRTFVDVTTTFSHAKGKTLAELARSTGRLADRFSRELPAIEALKPPPSVATAFTTLTMCLNHVGRDLRRTYVALKSKDFVAAGQALGSLERDATAAMDAAAEVSRKLDHK